MLTDDIFDHRVNRLISLGRAALAVVALIATRLDPTHTDERLYALLNGYTFYALAVAALHWAGRLASPALGLVTHLLDLLVFAALLYLTDGATSPFFPLLIFALLAATLRWRWRGAMWTTLLLLAFYVSMGLSAYPSALAEPMELQRFMIRSTHLAVAGAILTFFGFYQERLVRDLLRLHTAPFDPAGETAPIPGVLRYTAAAYRADRAVFAWSDPEEPWLYIAQWDRGGLEESFVPPDRYDPLIAKPLQDRPFLYRRGREAYYRRDEVRLAAHTGEAVHAGFSQHIGMERTVVIPIAGGNVEGWLFVPARRAHPLEALAVADQLQTRIVAAFDRAAAHAAESKATASEQQLRLARDLHDGVLQFLAGAAMQLESLVTGPDDPTERRERLRALRDAVTTEQRELRSFIRRLRPGSALRPDGTEALAPDLMALVERLRLQWRVDIHLSVQPPDLPVPAGLHYDLHQLVREAAANAVRHGRSKWINIIANRDRDFLHLTVSDDGCGLGLHGTFGAGQLAELGIGPRSLRERAQSLGGTINVMSASLGTLVCLSIPLREQGGPVA